MSSYLQAGTSRAPSEDESERRKVGTMRALVEARHPSAKVIYYMHACSMQELDDATIRRFLRARNLDVEKGSAMQWRKEFVPNGGFQANEVIGSGLCSNELFLQGCDRNGRPILVILAGRHKPIPNILDFKRYATYATDKICSRIPSGEEKFNVIMNMKGYGYANNDIRGMIAGLAFLQVCMDTYIPLN